MTVKEAVRVGAVVALLFVALVGWYSIAADYDYGALSGTYSLRLDGETSTLVLNRDRTFQQEVTHEGKIDHAQGSWRRIGEGGVVFSKEFMRMSGQEVRPDGQADAEVRKTLGLFPSIHFEPYLSGPVFRKKYFH